jgi:hypothetical protein
VQIALVGSVSMKVPNEMISIPCSAKLRKSARSCRDDPPHGTKDAPEMTRSEQFPQDLKISDLERCDQHDFSVREDGIDPGRPSAERFLAVVYGLVRLLVLSFFTVSLEKIGNLLDGGLLAGEVKRREYTSRNDSVEFLVLSNTAGRCTSPASSGRSLRHRHVWSGCNRILVI